MTEPASNEQLTGQVNAAIAADAAAERELNLEEHAELLRLACRAAAQLENARTKAGIDPVAQAPWPESTWAFLKRHAQAMRK